MHYGSFDSDEPRSFHTAQLIGVAAALVVSAALIAGLLLFKALAG